MGQLELAPPMPYELIEWRPDGKPRDNRCRWVAYVDARHSAQMLDEWVGPANWREHYEPGPNPTTLWCIIEVRDPETGDWIAKRDIGVATQFQPEKGLVSDAFKRAAVKWGIARNVYALPFVWATCKVDGKGNATRAKETDASIKHALEQHGVKVETTLIAEMSEEEGNVRSPPAPPPARPIKEPQNQEKSGTTKKIEHAAAVEIIKVRNQANLLDDEGKAQVKAVLAELKLTKKKFTANEVTDEQLAAIDEVVMQAFERMGEPWPVDGS